jgi:hypothetical protein
MNVFFTVDTEFHPINGWISEETIKDDIGRDIDGTTPFGEFGTYFQAEILTQHGLKAVFFVEALSGRAAASYDLRTVVERIRACGHEVGLHLHPEWLRRVPSSSFLPGRSGSLMRHFSLEDQTLLVAKGIEHLRACGVDTVHSFRAGGYGANVDTLHALARNGVRYDSSHNASWMGSTCDIQTDEPLLQPKEIAGVYEFPVTNFQDWPGHSRHAELCACSSRELEFALLAAWRKGWHSVVIVSHSFEMIKGRQVGCAPPWYPDYVVINRFKRLCRFLQSNRDKFQTATFADLDASTFPHIADEPVAGRLWNTAWRFAEQAYRRLS